MTIARTVDRLLAIARDKAHLTATEAALRANLKAVLEDRARQDGGAPTVKVKGLGTVRLDLEGDLRPTVADRDALLTHIAGRLPEVVTGLIRVPADRLEDALDALDAAGILGVTSTLDAADNVVDAYLDGLDVEQGTNPDGTPSWTATLITVEGEVVDVPGVAGTRSKPTLVVRLDPDAKRAAVEQGVADAERDLDPEHHELEPEPAKAWVEPPLPAWALESDREPVEAPAWPDEATEAERARLVDEAARAQHPAPSGWDAMTVAELKRACHALGIPKGGRRADLIARLEDHDASTGAQA